MSESDAVAPVKAKSLPMPLKGQDPQDWADFGASCRESGTAVGVEVARLMRFQLRERGVGAPARLSVLVDGVEPRVGSTSVRVDVGLRREYVAACKTADTSVEREVRGLVRWQLGLPGARRPERLVSFRGVES